jgi:cobalt-zinc-cadmium efflux system outer membrane protein
MGTMAPHTFIPSPAPQQPTATQASPFVTAQAQPVFVPPTQPIVVAQAEPVRSGIIQIGFQEPEKGGMKGENGQDKKEGPAAPKEKITLPMAIQLCIAQNFRLLAGAERVHQAEADLLTSSLIPNSSLFTDYQLIPLQDADIHNQLGPPQADVLVSIPIDWLLFGKRVAAMDAARLGIAVKNADYADLHRLQVARTVDAFYEVLADEGYLKLAEENHEDLEKFEKVTEEMAKNNKAGALELDQLKLAVLEAFLEIHERERTLAGAKARLRPLIGRSATDPDFEVEGVLTVKAVVPPPRLADALALADAHRPDLISDQHDIARAQAIVAWEQRKAKPSINIVPGISYQNQQSIDGFRNGAMFDIGIETTLPFTDRNQGNIAKARALEQEMYHTYQADRADALAEVEATLANYEDAVEDVTQNNTPETLKAAHELVQKMEAAYRAGERRVGELLVAHHAYHERISHVLEFNAVYWRTLNKLNEVVGLNAYDQDTGATQRVGEAQKR